ncbi:TFIIB-type zinc ribbon-containing protein [Pseudomonas sp. NBRC 111135]|uniref:TFIIB-type zinc ribbon-containing protein n=1 Tax=Pseudomonas sp. NBRC 111135 TaxID=1661050 RepID=UPI000A4D2D76|nr:zf-TFIIB domain-containing protein [Pseudomonas sp. NBRC 111135]
MKCPKCGHEPTLKELQDSPDDCTHCGVNFAKYRQIQAREEQGREATALAMAKASPQVRAALTDYPGAQPVVVIDLNMNFWSMVKFMVKWAFASIPALLIIFALGLALSVAWNALLGFPGMGKVPSSVVPGASIGEPAESTYMDMPSEPDVAYFLLKMHKSDIGTVDLELKRNAPSGVTYQALSVDCTTRMISVDASSPTYSGMIAAQSPGAKVKPPIGTTRDFLISRACR